MVKTSIKKPLIIGLLIICTSIATMTSVSFAEDEFEKTSELITTEELLPITFETSKEKLRLADLLETIKIFLINNNKFNPTTDKIVINPNDSIKVGAQNINFKLKRNNIIENQIYKVQLIVT